jgi:hypothetical protein
MVVMVQQLLQMQLAVAVVLTLLAKQVVALNLVQVETE